MLVLCPGLLACVLANQDVDSSLWKISSTGSFFNHYHDSIRLKGLETYVTLRFAMPPIDPSDVDQSLEDIHQLLVELKDDSSAVFVKDDEKVTRSAEATCHMIIACRIPKYMSYQSTRMVQNPCST